MTEEKRDLMAMDDHLNPNLPDFMREDAASGTEDLGQYVRPPRLKVIQKSAHPPLCDNFSTGDVIMMPQQLLVAPVNKEAKAGESFFFNPVFFFAEYVSWNPIQLKGKEPAIIERSFDRNSAVAQKARDPDRRKEVMNPDAAPDKQMFIRHVEHLNFIGLLVDHEYSGLPIVLSFSKGEARTGQNFASLIKMRRGPLWGMQFECFSKHRPGTGEGDWYGIDVINPSEESGVTPWILDEAAYKRRCDLHEELKEQFESRLIIVEHGDDDVVDEEREEGNAQSPF